MGDPRAVTTTAPIMLSEGYQMKEHEALLTTGEVARYCGVSRMGVLRWIRAGKLKAYTTPGGHYRIRAADFHDFLKRFNIPIDASFFKAGPQRILVVANDVPILGTIVKALSAMSDEYEIDVALDQDSAAAKIAHTNPALLILDGAMPGIDLTDLVRRFRAGPEERSASVLILATPSMNKVSDGPAASADSAGSVFLRRSSLDVESLQSTVRRLLPP